MSGQKNPRSKRIRNITNTPGIFLRQKRNRNVVNLKEIAYSHYLHAKRKRRRANTCEGYASALRLHVIPRFGAMKLEAITPRNW